MRWNPCLTVFLVLAVLALSAADVRAVELPPRLVVPPEAQAEDFLKGLGGRVALTPREIEAVRPILIEAAQKRQDLARTRLAENPGMPGMLALRSALQALGKETDGKLSVVLPPEKMAAVRAYQQERRQEIRTRLEQARKGG